MRIHLTAAIAATMSLAPIGALAAPTSMIHTLPATSAQSASTGSGPFSWATKWFREKPADGPAAGPIAGQAPTATHGLPTDAIAYQPPSSAPLGRQAVAVATPAAATAAHAAAQPAAMNNAWHGFSASPAPRTPISQVTAGIGGPGGEGATPADDARALREQGHANDRAGDLAAAELLYRQAIAADPTSAAAVNDLGLCLARQGKLEPSAAVLHQAIMMRPDKQLYRNNMATVLVELGRTDEALAQLNTVCEPATAHYNVGQLLVRGGKPLEAQTQFEQAIAVDPSLAPAHEALAKLTIPASGAAPAQAIAAQRPEPLAVAQAAPAPVEATMPVEPATPDEDDQVAPLSGPPSFPRLLPPVLSR